MVLSTNKPLPEPTLVKFFVVIWTNTLTIVSLNAHFLWTVRTLSWISNQHLWIIRTLPWISNQHLSCYWLLVLCWSLSVTNTRGPNFYHGLTWLSGWICNYINSKVWDEVTYPFPSFHVCTLEVWAWTNNFTSHFARNVLSFDYHFSKTFHLSSNSI